MGPSGKARLPTPASGEQLPIGVVSMITGVNAVTLRAWERRYGLIQPVRTANGQRLYTHRDIEQIRRALALVDRGVPISRVRDLLEADVAPQSARSLRGPWPELIGRMAVAIAGFDELELDRIYDEALSIHSIDRVNGQLLLPLLVQLGERWDRLPGGVAEEHFFATYLRSKLGARLMHRMRYATGPKLVAACAEGEHHEIGLLLFAIEAHAADMQTVLLGADTPFAETVAAQRRVGGDAVVISASFSPTPDLMNEALPKLIRQCGVPVFVGGTIAIRHRKAVAATGATPLAVDIRDSIRIIKSVLMQQSKTT
jgi:MerR family transcriptional regulator, light-induced transcriptional regulator